MRREQGGNARVRVGAERMESSSSHWSQDRFYKNCLGQSDTDGQTRVAHLADDTGVTGQKLDALAFAESYLAQAMSDLG